MVGRRAGQRVGVEFALRPSTSPQRLWVRGARSRPAQQRFFSKKSEKRSDQKRLTTVGGMPLPEVSALTRSPRLRARAGSAAR
jgi:hypothetical protein